MSVDSMTHLEAGPSQSLLQQDSHGFTSEKDFHNESRPTQDHWTDKHSAEIALNELGDLSSIGADPIGQHKVAFLFLLLDGVDNEDIWDSFFDGAEARKFSIYIHQAHSTTMRPFAKWGAVTVPHVPSSWGTLSGVEVAVFGHALANEANAQFVLLSQDAVPLKPFSYIYSQLAVESPDTSKICYSRVFGPGEKPWIPEHPLILKHHQWVVLSRRHAVTFVKNVLDAIGEFYGTDSSGGVSDEATVSAALLLASSAHEGSDEVLNKIGVQQACLTWVYWNSFHGTPLDLTGKMEMPKEWEQPGRFAHPLSFGPQGATLSASYLSMLVTQEGFMFGRKFQIGCSVSDGLQEAPLSSRLPLLWKMVSEANTSSRIWSRLDVTGMPPTR